jgi:hypothetical protein
MPTKRYLGGGQFTDVVEHTNLDPSAILTAPRRHLLIADANVDILRFFGRQLAVRAKVWCVSSH